MKSKLYSIVTHKILLTSLSIFVLVAITSGTMTAIAPQDPTSTLGNEETRSANAQPYTFYVTSQATLAPGGTGAAVATCPSGSVVVGGGYSADSGLNFYTQYKYGNGWRGDAKNNTSGKARITVYAVCLDNVVGVSVTQIHGQVDILAGGKGQAVATCPAGSIATGGGYHAYPDGSLWVYNTSRNDIGEGWQTWARNLSGSTKTHHAYAICLSGSGGVVTDILESVNVSPNSTASALPQCNLGSLVTAGGFAAQDNLLMYASYGPTSSNQWRVEIRNTISMASRTAFTYAICLFLPPQGNEDLYLPIALKP